MTKAKRGSFGKYISGLLSFADLVIVNILFAITVAMYPTIAESQQLKLAWVLVNVSYAPVMIWFRDPAHQQRVVLMERVIRSAFRSVGIHALFFLSLVAFLNVTAIPVHAYITFYVMMAVVIPLWWIISRRIIKTLRRNGYNFLRVVIVGTGPTARRLYEEINTDAGFGYRVLGFFSDNPEPGFPYKVLGTIDDLDEFAKNNSVDQVFYTISGENREAMTKTVAITDNNMMQFYYVPQISRQITGSFELHSIGAVPVMSLRYNPLSNALKRFIKRTFDIVFSGIVLLLSPLWLLPAAIAIKLSSPGPVFFVQERTGYKGRTFRCYKFRTMRVNDDADARQATADDPRTTALGRFMRRTSIDELPQFINVFLGDMSVVGPRPHMLKHTDEYAKLIDKYMVRHVVKPGITGWAQVNGYRGITDELWKMERRVECDVWYIENWSFLLDLKIIARTVINAIGGEKNAF